MAPTGTGPDGNGGAGMPPGGNGAGGGREGGPGAPPASPFTPGFAPECLACPFGLLFFGLRNTKPEVMEHLMRAGFEVFQAAKAFMDSYAQRWDDAQRLQRIPIA